MVRQEWGVTKKQKTKERKEDIRRLLRRKEENLEKHVRKENRVRKEQGVNK